jgi:hypothetical protein
MAINVSRPSKNQSMPFTADARSEFEAFLLSNGMSVDPKKGLVSDGSVGRAYMEVDGKRKLTGWYQLWLNQSVPYGRCGDYRLDHVNPTAQWRPNNGARYEMTEDQKGRDQAAAGRGKGRACEQANEGGKDRSEHLGEVNPMREAPIP